MTPQNSKEIERAVLGTILIDPHCAPLALSRLFEDVFYSLPHQLIFKAITGLYDDSTPIDILTVVERLKREGNLERVGGLYEVTKLTNDVTSSAHLETHIMLLLEFYLKRKGAEIGHDLQIKATDNASDAFDIMNECSDQVLKAVESVTKGKQASMANYLTKLIEQRDRIKATGQIGINTGFDSLNECISGWVNPDLVIIAARPAMGKSAFMLSTIHFAAVKMNIPTAVFSLEMSGMQLVERLESLDSGIYHSNLRHNRISHNEQQKLYQSHDRLIKAPIYIDDTPGINIRELRTKATLLKRKHDIKLLVLDYLQLMSGVDERGKSRDTIIGEISRGCKKIAKELDIPVIALSQLSRAVESRADKMPQLSDLRESGSIEADADEVVFLMRPEYYGFTEPVIIGSNSYDTQGLVIIKIDKNRHGACKNIALRFTPELMKFSNYEAESTWKPINNFRPIRDITEAKSFDDDFKDDNPF